MEEVVMVVAEKYRNAKTSVWWDMDKCRVTEDGSCDPNNIAHNIISALLNMTYCGPITIFAYGDIQTIPISVQRALSSTAITLTPLPSGSGITRIVADMLFWTVDNPAPANYLLLSGDSGFSYTLHQLRMRKYNILLALPPNSSATLVAAAKNVWSWTSILTGGPSMSKDELSKFGDCSNKISHSMTKTPIYEMTQINQPFVVASENSWSDNHVVFPNGNGRDKGSKAKQIWRSSSESNISKTSKVKDGIQDQGNGNSNWSGSPKMINIAPHEFFIANEHDASFNLIPTSHCSTINNGNGLQVIRPHQFSQNNSPVQHDFVPDKFFQQDTSTQNNLPAQPNFAPDKFFGKDSSTHGSHQMLPIPNGSAVASSSYTNSREHQEYISKPYFEESNGNSNLESLTQSCNLSLDSFTLQNIQSFPPDSQNNRYHCHGPEFLPELSLARSTDPLCSSGVWGTPGCPKPSEYVQGLIGTVLLALDTLKHEKIIPTEANITDCVRYGDPMHRNTDVRAALNYAMEQHMILRQSAGAVQIYTFKNARIWTCVNPLGGSPKNYSKATWNEIQNYLSSSGGRFRMMASNSRYEAATILKNFCLQYLALGDVFQILNMILNTKKWIIVHPSGWQPITITLGEITTETV